MSPFLFFCIISFYHLTFIIGKTASAIKIYMYMEFFSILRFFKMDGFYFPRR